MNSRFNFTGELSLPKDTSKRPFVKEGESKDHRASLSMNFGVKASQSNMGFVEAYDTVQDAITTMNQDNEKIEIAWADRFDPETVAQVAYYKRYVADLGEAFGGRKEFITMYDLIQFLSENLPDYKGRVTVIGELRKDWYKDRYTDRFRFQSVYAVDDDAEKKNGLLISMDVFYNKSSVDKADFKDTKRVILNGFIEQYINSTEKTKYIPHTFIFDTSKYDMENPAHKKQFDFKMRFVDLNAKKMQHMLWEVVLLRGAEEVEFDESMLTDLQREQVELGLKTLEEFKPRGNIFGNRVFEYRLKMPVTTGDFANGMVDTDLSEDEFSEQIYVPTFKEEALPETGKSSKAAGASQAEPKPAAEEVDEDDLF